MNQLSRIAPISDADAARVVRASTLADLAGQITATGVPATVQPARRNRRRLALAAIATPVVAGVATAAIVLAATGQPAARTRVTPQAGASRSGAATRLTAALSFTTSGGYITVQVVNPLADASRYRAEFAQHHLDIGLTLVPVSPSLVGTLVYFSEVPGNSITPITAKGRCFTGGGGSQCPVGVRIPASFRGQAQIVFGRAARPGEQYESTAPVTARGEVMHGLTFRGLTVSRVLAMLRQRHVTVPVYNYDDHGYGKLLHSVPGTWHVYDADPWALNQVMLFVGPVWPEPAQNSAGPQPAPTASG